MSTTRRPAARWRCCCAPARRPRARRCAAICDASSAASAASADTGPRPASRSAAMATTAARGDGVVRKERGRLHLWPARQPCARPAGRRNRRRHPHPARARPETRPARLCRNPLPGQVLEQVLEQAAPRLRPHRGHHQGARHPQPAPAKAGVTSLQAGSAEHVYETLYCARGQAENPGLRRGRL